MSNKDKQVSEVIQSTITDFNSVLQDFIEFLTTVTPRSTLANNKETVFKIMKTTRFRTVFVNKFVKHVLAYKSKIDNHDDGFFLGDEFTKKVLTNDELVTNLTDIGGNNTENTIMEKIFEFKQFWSTFSGHDKDICFTYMQTLCALAEDYFVYTFDELQV